MPTIVVTGASSGLGLEMVRQFAARGDKVFATCRSKAGSLSKVDAISEVSGDVTVIEGIDVTSDEVGSALLASALNDVPIDVLIHNAGSVNGTRDLSGGDVFADQKLDTVSMERMRAAFEVNTLGPLRIQQALNAQLQEGGKVIIVSTGFGSIGDNGSGGNYAYRTSKAGANMVAKSMSCDLKARSISVTAIAPGMVVTDFGPGSEMMAKFGAGAVEPAVEGIIKVIDGMSMDNSGSFIMVPTKDPMNSKPMQW